MFMVTLKQLRENGACFSGYNRVVRALQGECFTAVDGERDSYIRYSHKDIIPLESILNSNGLDDALWATQCLVGYDRDLRLFAVWCARQVQYLMQDKRSKIALDVAASYANGQATIMELSAARAAAYTVYDSAYTAYAAATAAYTAARAAYAAATAAYATAAYTAARAAVNAARAATSTTAAQKEMFILMCQGKAPWQISERK